MGKRHEARILAIKILYAIDIKGEFSDANESYLDEINKNWNEKLTSFTKEIVLGVSKDISKIDSKITETSKHWKLDRMSIIDRNILRLGMWELLNNEATAIVINEAVLLAQKFGSDNSTAFINGILDNAKVKISKETAE